MSLVDIDTCLSYVNVSGQNEKVSLLGQLRLNLTLTHQYRALESRI